MRIQGFIFLCLLIAFSLLTPQSAQAAIRGSVDTLDLNSGNIYGWVCDTNTPNQDPEVVVFATSYTSSTCITIAGEQACAVKTTLANEQSEDAVKTQCGGKNRRFSLSLDRMLADSKLHKIYIYTRSNSSFEPVPPSKDIALFHEYYRPAGYAYSVPIIHSSASELAPTSLDKTSPYIYNHYCPENDQQNQLGEFQLFFNNSYFSYDDARNAVGGWQIWCNSWRNLSWSLASSLGINWRTITESGADSQRVSQAAGVYKEGSTYLYGLRLQPYTMMCQSGSCDKDNGYFILAPNLSFRSTDVIPAQLWSIDPNALIEVSLDLSHPSGAVGQGVRVDGDEERDEVYGSPVLLLRDMTKSGSDPTSHIWISPALIHLQRPFNGQPQNLMHFDGASSDYLVVGGTMNPNHPYLSIPDNTHGHTSQPFSDIRKYGYVLSSAQFLKILTDAEAKFQIDYNTNLADWAVLHANYSLEMLSEKKVPSEDSYLSMIFANFQIKYHTNNTNLAERIPSMFRQCTITSAVTCANNNTSAEFSWNLRASFTPAYTTIRNNKYPLNEWQPVLYPESPNSSGDIIRTITDATLRRASVPIQPGREYGYRIDVYARNAAGDYESVCHTAPTPGVENHASYSCGATNKPADLNGSGKVDIFDYNLLVGAFNTQNCSYNILGSCTIDIFDYNALIAAFGQ